MSPSATMHRNEIMSAAFCGSPINILPRKSIDDVGGGWKSHLLRQAKQFTICLVFILSSLSRVSSPFIYNITYKKKKTFDKWRSCDASFEKSKNELRTSERLTSVGGWFQLSLLSKLQLRIIAALLIQKEKRSYFQDNWNLFFWFCQTVSLSLCSVVVVFCLWEWVCVWECRPGSSMKLCCCGHCDATCALLGGCETRIRGISPWRPMCSHWADQNVFVWVYGSPCESQTNE